MNKWIYGLITLAFLAIYVLATELNPFTSQMEIPYQSGEPNKIKSHQPEIQQVDNHITLDSVAEDEKVTKMSAASNDTLKQENPQDLSDETEAEQDNNALISDEEIKEMGFVLSFLNDEEIALLRRHLSGNPVEDHELEALFAIIMLPEKGNNNEQDFIAAHAQHVDPNWFSEHLYNGMQYWQDSAANGDVLATIHMAIFYDRVKRTEESLHQIKKLYVNIEEQEDLGRFIIELAMKKDPIEAATWAFYLEEQGIELQIPKKDRELIAKHDKKQLSDQIWQLKNEMVELESTFGRSEKVTIKDYFK